MIDIQAETILRMADAHSLPDSVTPKTLRYWIRVGLLSKVTGDRVFLESAQRNGRIVTSVEAYHRFNIRLNGEVVGEDNDQWVREKRLERRRSALW